MLIRHKLVLLFIVFSGVLLSLFSVYIYVASSTSRKNIFRQRIKDKAYATREIYELRDKVAEKIITSLPEQSEYVFDENGKLIFAINDVNDYTFDRAFFDAVSVGKEKYFEYRGDLSENYKEGYAFSFESGGKKRTIAITAYNKNNFEQLDQLKYILIFGNLFFLASVGIAAFTFSNRAFRPVNDVVRQVEAIEGHDLNFRLSYRNSFDEIGIVASSFNRVLDRIQTLVESQKSFISYASHELRTPLAAIAGILETSLNYDKDQQAMRESMKAAHKEIQKATVLVNGLLQLAKIESSASRDDKIKFHVVDLLLDVISFYKIKNPLQEFSFDIAESARDTSIEVLGHSQFLRTAFINVIDNASKYSYQQKIWIKLNVENDHKIRIQVIDKGIGIGSEDRQQLFDVFYRGKNANGFEGFGLGLSLTQKIISIHGGEVKLLRNADSGMTAEIVLPAIVTR